MQPEWYIHWGLHRGTITSRDFTVTGPFESEGAARAKWLAIKEGFARGEYVWFATLMTPWDTPVILDNGVPYDR